MLKVWNEYDALLVKYDDVNVHMKYCYKQKIGLIYLKYWEICFDINEVMYV